MLAITEVCNSAVNIGVGISDREMNSSEYEVIVAALNVFMCDIVSQEDNVLA